MTQEEARKSILKAIFSDDWLFNHLVLKGGNALSLIYNVGNRTSLDLDFSIEDDFENLEKVSDCMLKALSSIFSEAGILVFDFKFEQKPRFTNDSWWGGYCAEF
jgi:predicted nucleotidyltransferase component of viral defense system